MNSFNSALEILKSSGFKTTDKRRKMLEILYAADKYLSAREVQERLEEVYPNISPDTIYRNLRTFEELNVLEQTELEGEKLFRSNCEAHGHHHHFICTDCGKTKEIDNCPLEVFQATLPGCTITSHRFELFGLCENCSAA